MFFPNIYSIYGNEWKGNTSYIAVRQNNYSITIYQFVKKCAYRYMIEMEGFDCHSLCRMYGVIFVKPKMSKVPPELCIHIGSNPLSTLKIPIPQKGYGYFESSDLFLIQSGHTSDLSLKGMGIIK